MGTGIELLHLSWPMVILMSSCRPLLFWINPLTAKPEHVLVLAVYTNIYKDEPYSSRPQFLLLSLLKISWARQLWSHCAFEFQCLSIFFDAFDSFGYELFGSTCSNFTRVLRESLLWDVFHSYFYSLWEINCTCNVVFKFGCNAQSFAGIKNIVNICKLLFLKNVEVKRVHIEGN